jgi:hypothetical protein
VTPRVDLASRLVAAETVRIRHLADGAVILHLESSHMFSLDTTAARMWTAIVQGGTLGDARDALLEVFEVTPERLEGDLLALADELLSLSLLREVV